MIDLAAVVIVSGAPCLDYRRRGWGGTRASRMYLTKVRPSDSGDGFLARFREFPPFSGDRLVEEAS